MTPGRKAKIIKVMGPFFYPAHILYLLVDDFRSWRAFPEWFCSFCPGYSLLKKPTPWLPFVATSWLQSYIRPDMKIFEYGSGGSTIFMAKRAEQVFSVEHDKSWYALVSEALLRHGVRNCFYQLREPCFNNNGRSSPCINHERALVADPSERENPGVSFESYVSTIDPHPDKTFDLVLVDGRARAECMKRALRKIKPDGYLMLDNANDHRLVDCLSLMQSYKRNDLHGIAPGWPPARWTTSIWRIA